jgi:hypothetical protein
MGRVVLKIWLFRETHRPHSSYRENGLAFWYAMGRSTTGIETSTRGVSQPVPRHREIKEQLARHIIRMLSVKYEHSGDDDRCE